MLATGSRILKKESAGGPDANGWTRSSRSSRRPAGSARVRCMKPEDRTGCQAARRDDVRAPEVCREVARRPALAQDGGIRSQPTQGLDYCGALALDYRHLLTIGRRDPPTSGGLVAIAAAAHHYCPSRKYATAMDAPGMSGWRDDLIVLVHGGYHGSWCLSDTAARLRELGHWVGTVDLPGRGDTAPLAATVTLDVRSPPWI